MNRITLAAAAMAALIAVPCLAETDVKPAEVQPKIQIAILLDTSSSMDGLINQTREQLWKIVNTFASAKRDGKRPKLQLALYEYGNDGLSREGNYIRQVSPLTTDLDKVSEQLFALRTNGGEEYCGAVIERATHQLEWSQRQGRPEADLHRRQRALHPGPGRLPQVGEGGDRAGHRGEHDSRGRRAAGVEGKWKDAAVLADGNFMVIDQNRAVAADSRAAGRGDRPARREAERDLHRLRPPGRSVGRAPGGAGQERQGHVARLGHRPRGDASRRPPTTTPSGTWSTRRKRASSTCRRCPRR